MDEHTEFRQMEATKQMQQVQRRNVNPPHFPWPTSKPGPMVTPPPPGTKPMPLRTEQVAEIGYDQERGVPSTYDPGRSGTRSPQGDGLVVASSPDQT